MTRATQAAPTAWVAQSGVAVKPVSNLRDRLAELRNRLLASPDFQRFAAAFPLTRGIARRRARALFDIVGGFVYTQVLLACVRLGVLEALRAGPLATPELAARVGLAPDAMLRLVDAAIALGLLETRSDGRCALGPHGAVLAGNGAVLAMIEHHPLLYRDLEDPVALLRGEKPHTELGRYWAYAGAEQPSGLPSAQVTAYTTLMAASQTLVADDILGAYPLCRHRCLLDVGGGNGTFLSTALTRTPGLRGLLLDLPPVAALASARLAELGLAERARAVGGDFSVDPWPEGADVISFVRVLHDHDDATVNGLLRRARAALPAGGRLLIAEPMSGARGAETMGAAYFGFYLLAMGRGRPRTPQELSGMLTAAGFEGIRRIPTLRPMQTELLEARVAR